MTINNDNKIPITNSTLTQREYAIHCNKMNSMAEILEYVLEHLFEPLTADIVAERFEYNRKYFGENFSEYFGLPFHSFLKKLRLRKAAEELLEKGSLKNEWEKYGFGSNISFSNAFRKEFQVSPRNFYNMGYTVPAMPEREKLFGIPIKMQYRHLPDMELIGHPVKPVHGNKTDLLAEAAYVLDHRQDILETDKLYEWFGVWWHDFVRGGDLYYLMAVQEDEADPGYEGWMETVKIPADYYAVFSYELRETPEENALISRLLARYALKEWKLTANHKPNTMGWTFERFDQERGYLYVPILYTAKGEMLPNRGSGVDTWVEYIDQHIEERLTTERLAEMAHYTPKSFRDIFHMYYEMDPMEYVRKRRLYEAAEKLDRIGAEADPAKLKRLAAKYHFTSVEEFEQQFRQEFEVSPQEYLTTGFESVNLRQFYRQNKEKLIMTQQVREDIVFLGKAIKSAVEDEDTLDIPDLASFWFKEEEKEIQEMIGKKTGSKVSCWTTREDTQTGETLYEYVLGPVWVKKHGLRPVGMPEAYQQYRIAGGRYMVFETMDPSDQAHLTAAYRTLTRCAFFGWFRENLYRYDGKRLTYVEYREEKLYFYVPIKG